MRGCGVTFVVENSQPPDSTPAFNIRSELWTMFMMGWPMVGHHHRHRHGQHRHSVRGHLTNETVGTALENEYSEQYLSAPRSPI